MRIVFMGTPDFAVPCLESIVEQHDVIAVYSQPDRPKGRGKKIQFPPVKEAAVKHDIPVFQPEKLNTDQAYNELLSLNPDCIVVVAYGQILSKRFLELPKHGCINVHASLLPAYRGAAPINWVLVNGETKTGVTTMHMDVGLDTGDMIHKSEIDITENMIAGDLHDLLSVSGAELILKTLSALEEGTAPREKQDNALSSYASMMNKKMSEIKWSMEAQAIHNQIRGFNPWPVSYTDYQGTRMKMYRSLCIEGTHQKESGTILNVSAAGMDVATGSGVLRVTEIQVPGSKRMAVKDYILGHEIKVGTRLGA